MPRRRSSRPRRLLAIGKWAGLCLCVAIAGVWLANRWVGVIWARDGRMFWVVGVAAGRIVIERLRSLGPTPWYGTFLVDLTPRRPHYWFDLLWGHRFGGQSEFELHIPLWAPFLLTAAPTALMWWRSRRQRPGHCRCGYNLAGLEGKPCPECGGWHGCVFTAMTGELRGTRGAGGTQRREWDLEAKGLPIAILRERGLDR